MRDERKLMWTLLAFAGAIRVVFFFLSVNGAGADAPPRALMAWEWSRHPVWITPGHWLPLQIWISGALLRIWNDVWLAPRVVSLVFGIATIWPFYKLVREFFSREVTVAAALIFALYGLHIGQSVMSGAEPIYFFFVMWALYHQARWSNTFEPRHLAFAGLFWMPALLTRHEAWWVAPLCVVLAGISALISPRRAKLILPVIIFGALVAVAPAFWMTVCAKINGDPLLNFHRSAGGSAYHARSTLYKAAFWPVGLTLSLGPLVVLLAVVGLARSLWSRQRWLLFAFMAAFVGPFWTMQFVGAGGVNVRHTLFVGMLLLPFAPFAIEKLLERNPERYTRWTLLAAALWLAGILVASETLRGEAGQKFASISARAKDRPHVMDAAGWVAGHARPTDRVVVDRFNDEESSLQFHVHVPPENVKICWGKPDDLRAFLTPMPRWLLVAPNGPLGQSLAGSGIPVTPRHSNDVYIVYEVTPSS